MTKKNEIAEKAIKKTKKGGVIGGDIVVHNPTNPTQEFVVASEFADDEAIEAELMGRAMEHYVYSFDQDGKNVTGLTVNGVNEMSRLLTKKKDSGIKIRVVPDSVKIERGVEENGQAGVSVILMAENMLTGETAIGAKFEPYKKTGRNGQYDNTFALEKAVSKAERNAKRKLIPEKIAVEMIKKFVNKFGVKELQAPEQRQTPVQQNNGINYLGKLVAMLAKEAGIKLSDKMTPDNWRDLVVLFNEYTGLNIKSLRVNQSTAQRYLMEFINCPIMVNKK